MFTERVKLLDQLKAPAGGLVTGPWLAQLVDLLKTTFGDCDATLKHRGPIEIDRPNNLFTPRVTDGKLVPGRPYPFTNINPDQPNWQAPPASLTFLPGASQLNPDTLNVENDLNIYAPGANYLGDGIFRNVVIQGDLTVLGDCSGCTGGDPGGGTVGAEPLRFRLTADLDREGYAACEILQVTGGVESVITTGRVGSWTGQWYGKAGAKGWCVLKSDSKDDSVPGATYHILWLDTWFMRFILKADLSLGGTATAKQIVGDTDTEVGNTFTVTDWLGRNRARDGAKGVVATFQDQPTQYLVMDIQKDAERIVVNATSSGGGITITGDLLRYYRGRNPVAVGSSMQVDDNEGRFGYVKPGDKLDCEFNDITGRYEVAGVTKNVSLLSDLQYNTVDRRVEYKKTPVTVWCKDNESDWIPATGMTLQAVTMQEDWQISGFNLQNKYRTLYVMDAGATGTFTTVAVGEEC